MNLDTGLQVAEMLYSYKGENFWYMISAGYSDFSFGIDAEDEIVEKEDVEVDNVKAELTVYRRNGSDGVKCTAHFTYQKLEYFLVTHVGKEELKNILKNLYFL